MKPAPFDYADPTSLDEALALVAEAGDDAVVIAGGQSLVPLLNLRLARPELVIDLRRIDALRTIDFDRGGLLAGAMARAVDVEEHPSVGDVPGLAQSLSLVGHSQIRARTTIGGSISHADPAAELPALLVALDGTVTVISRDRGERTIAARDFFVGPLMTDRRGDELVTSIRFPRHRGRAAVEEVATRPGDFAIVGAVVALAVVDGSITDPRIVLFGVGATPVRVGEAEVVLRDAPATSDVFRRAGELARDDIDPPSDHHGSGDYRRHLAATLVERVLYNRRRMSGPRHVELVVNGETRSFDCDARELLSDALRHRLGLTGTHVGCEQGACGACTVIVDGRAQRSCLVLAVQVDGSSIETIEGVADDGVDHPVQRAMHEQHGLQCGFCTPGIVMSLVDAHRRGVEADIAKHEVLDGHICRCTGYVNIRAAIDAAWHSVSDSR